MFDAAAVKKSVVKAKCALELERNIVGVKFLFTRKEFDAAAAPQPTSRMRYCAMVERASRGEKIKADLSNFACLGGARALGIVEREEFYVSGRYFKPLGLYQDLATSKSAASQIPHCNHRLYGVQVMPLEEFTDAPDVVLIITGPRNIMRLLQGYTYYFGVHGAFKMSGNQAICAECTAHPYETNDINVSVLCAGPRSGGMQDSEMAVGMPFNRFEKVIDGLCLTITPVEDNESKRRITEKLEQNGITDVRVIPNRSYMKISAARNAAYVRKQQEQQATEEETLPDIWSDEGNI